ncbi:MAG: DNA helicase [Sphingopyxis sp.]|nr:MAG: DNA helicase [Sphingopyxis sp.]
MSNQESTMKIHATLVGKINFACHQSAFALLRELQIENLDSEQALSDLSVVLEASPAFVKQKIWVVDRLAAGGLLSMKDRDLELDGGFLFGLTESMRGTVTIRVRQGDDTLAERVIPVELLARNEWGGAGYMPELLAAFCTPNDPAVDRLLGQASQILRKAGKPDGIDGYSTNSRERVWLLASAIYSAIVKMQLGYALPPASFERDGQKVRLPSQIESAKVATCLDTTLLFAAALEQAQLNPMVIITKGHALVGLWLEKEDLASVVVEEAEILRQRIPLQELILIETTLMTQHPAVPFSGAVQEGARQLALEKDHDFIAAVDIRRARGHRINPLSLGLKIDSTVAMDGVGESVEPGLEDAPSLPGSTVMVEADPVEETPGGRLDRWQRKLLDLSARNPLINHKSSKSSLTIVCGDPAALEDALASGARISIAPFPQLQTQNQDEDIYRQRTGGDLKEEYARDALAKKQVLVDVSQDELDKRAVEIYRRAQTSLKEGGSNTLFLAVGFLLWKQKDKDDRRYRAPLILLPVTLERKSVRSGVKMIASDDEPRFNTTLLEMLKKDFGIEIRGLGGALPEDESGVDVAAICTRVRHAIKDVPGFEVVEDVVLGHFSFAKYLMWKDLVDRSAALKESPVVKHLLDTPREPYDSDIRFVDARDIDKDYTPADLLAPLPADSAQMAAIATADRGKDFVIIGPPGTGKSQTISNLIAHMLGKGKKVLFVSEKTAALEVVYRRLRDIGLGQFCLQLHSNKAKKADVLDQLRTSWNSAAQSQVSQWQVEADRLKALRDRLNLVVNALHQPRRNGLTPHYAIGIKVRDGDLAAKASLSWASADHHDDKQLQQLRDMAALLGVQAKALGKLVDHPLQAIAQYEWSSQWQGDLVRVAGSVQAAAQRLGDSLAALEKSLDVELGVMTFPKLVAVAEFGQVMLGAHRTQASFALEPNATDRLEALEDAVTRLKRYIATQAKLSCQYAPLAWKALDADRLGAAWTEANNRWWPKSFFAKRKVLQQIRAGGAQGEPDPNNDIAVLRELRDIGSHIERLDGVLQGLKEWKSYDSDPEAMASLQALGARARTAVSKLAEDAASLAALREKMRTLLYEANDMLAPEAPVGRAIVQFLAALADFKTYQAQFESLTGSALDNLVPSCADALGSTSTLGQRIIEHHMALRDWCAWVRRRSEAMDLQLGPLVHAIENGAVQPDEVVDVFEAAYCAWWSSAVIDEDEVLRTFSSPEHEAAILRFRALDSQFTDLTAQYIAARLAGQIPNEEEVKQSSSWGVLRRELQKKSRHKPVREMMEEMPDVITSLAPCLMMSPLSIAQFLPAGQALFDVVIFDEASQITVWDAVGSLARGRQAIVVGDPKQMPPTNFFARADEDPDGDIDEEGDLESILDELLGASIPQRVLNLHYRSRRESLIAFSNSRYYDSSLVTFPAPVHPDKGVSLVRPEGFYARGKARHNQGEAKAIVAEIVRRLTSGDPAVRQQSIGVVTFNTEQQSLIEDLLDKARSDDPAIEWAFSEDVTLEPVFVKNLETVQGDERDVILFSITYGPDETGHVTMNFGPLNRTGGERRLNVAMTRARSEMVVFSTVPPERIDLSRTQARAVADLKHFLEYAERGAPALAAAVHGSRGDYESPFEVAVARGLQDKGWIVHPQIGVSAYRIDMAIVHPDKPGLYLAGVECDGAMYHSSAYARERDKIRQNVLEGLGWTLFRVWSTDWWTNKAKALDQLHQQLTCLLEAVREQEIAHSVAVPEQADRDDVAQQKHAGPTVARVDVEDDQHSYVKASLGGFSADSELFYHTDYDPVLREMVLHLVDQEGPIHEDLVVRRVARQHGFQRAGRQIRERVVQFAAGYRRHTKEDVGTFYWPEETGAEGRQLARIKGRDEEAKKLDYICSQELADILAVCGDKGDFVKICQVLGIGRLTQQMRSRLEGVVSELMGPENLLE